MDLSGFFHTKQQASDFSARLADISEEIYKTDFNLEKILIDKLSLEKKEKFIILMRDNNINHASQSGLKDFLDKLQEKISQLPLLSITLAFEPKEETLNLISEWFLLNLKKQFVFDINVNLDLIAGIIINFNGKFKDYSIKSRFDKIISDIVETEVKSNTPIKHQAIGNVS